MIFLIESESTVSPSPLRPDCSEPIRIGPQQCPRCLLEMCSGTGRIPHLYLSHGIIGYSRVKVSAGYLLFWFHQEFPVSTFLLPAEPGGPTQENKTAVKVSEEEGLIPFDYGEDWGVSELENTDPNSPRTSDKSHQKPKGARTMSQGTPTSPLKKPLNNRDTTELNLKRKSKIRIFGLFQNAKIICQKKGKKKKWMFLYLKLLVITA